MTASATSAPVQPAVRGTACPLCETPAGRPCQDKPSGDHLARYLDAFTAGQLTRAYMAMVLGELVVVDACVVIGWDEPGTGTWTGEVSHRVVRKDAPASSGLVGRLVEDVCDDSPCPLVGLVVGQVDEDTLEVLWGDRRFEENPGRGTYEPFDALRPARSQGGTR